MSIDTKQINEQIRILTFAREGWPIEKIQAVSKHDKKLRWKPCEDIEKTYDSEFWAYRVVLPPLPENHRLLEMGEALPMNVVYVLSPRNKERMWFEEDPEILLEMGKNRDLCYFIAVPIEQPSKQPAQFPPCPSPHGWLRAQQGS